jgi:ABC-type multidrug transport system fused ATPase/permease subunit
LSILVVFLFAPCAHTQDTVPSRVAVYVDGGTSAGKETVLQALANFHDFKAESGYVNKNAIRHVNK